MPQGYRSRCHCGVDRWALKKLDRHVQDFSVSCSHEKDFSMTIRHSQLYSKVLRFDSGFKHITPESDYMTLHDEGLSLKDPLISIDTVSVAEQKQQSRTWVLIDNKTKQNILFCLCILSISASKFPPRLSRVGDFSAQVSATLMPFLVTSNWMACDNGLVIEVSIM